ncbi:hypothetical protein KP509_02G048300 [Ceratopteris richardii]|nr:hypothetical protein KP509_02G048300 [Ceratopteris richardii]
MDVKNAEIALIKARAGIVDTVGEEIIDKDVERKESAKAAGVAGVVGSLAVIPFYSLTGDLDNVEIILKTGMAFISCALFGLTYRYVVRRDLINTQLRAGCIAAFALVRCFAQVDAARLLSNISQKEITELLSTGSLFAAESIAIFSFAAVGLEYCMQQGIVSPFPSKRQ